MAGTICITFDHHNTVPLKLLADNGLVGTYFVSPATIGATGGPTVNSLLAMKMNGIEIGLYSGRCILKGKDYNMVQAATLDRMATNKHLLGLKNGMEAKGFPVLSLAPNQRAWSSGLAGIARGMFTHVRVASDSRVGVGHWQALPVPDRLYVKGGGTASLSASDTANSLSAQLDDLIANGGLWIVVIHRVATSGDAGLTIAPSVLSTFFQYVKSKITSGDVTCIRFCDL